MKTFTITRLITPNGQGKTTRLGISSFLALFSLIFVSNSYGQLLTAQSNENYFSPSIFNNEKPKFHVTSEGTLTDNNSLVKYTMSASSPTAFKPQSANLDQIRNGSTDVTATTPAYDWVNGNAGKQNAHYAEGWSIGYRMRLENLVAGTHTLVIEWDTRAGGKSVIDFITHYQNMDEPVGSHVATFGHTQEQFNPKL